MIEVSQVSNQIYSAKKNQNYCLWLYETTWIVKEIIVVYDDRF